MDATNVIWLIVLIGAVGAVALYLIRSKPAPPPIAGEDFMASSEPGSSPSSASAADDASVGALQPDDQTAASSPMDADPLGAHFDVPSEAPGLADSASRTEMAPAGQNVTLPESWSEQLRGQGLDPDNAAAGDLVLGLLRGAGYNVTESGENAYSVSKGGAVTFVMVDPYEEGGYPEIDEDVMARFSMAFANSKAGNGLYVTDRFAPFSVYDQEKRNSRVRFISRERIQQFADGITGGITG